MWRVDLLIVLLLFSTVGCAHVCTQRVEVLDLDTFRTVSFQGKSKCWDELVPPALQSQEVAQLCPDRDNLVLVTRSRDGTILHEKSLPLFDPYFRAKTFALRPDSDAAAYFPSRSTAVHLFDFASKRQTQITEDLTRNHWHINALVWADNRYLFVLLGDELDEVRNAQGERSIVRTVPGSLVKVDTDAKAIVGKVLLENPHECALSPSGKLLAIAHFSKTWAPIKIFDTRSLSVVTTVPGASQLWMHSPAWCPDETALAYCEGVRSTRTQWLSVFSLRTGSSTRILQIPDHHVCYFVGFPRADLLVFLTGDPDKDKSQMCFVKLPSGEVQKTVTDDFNGLSAVFANGQAIASQKGY